MPKYRLYIDEVGNSDLRASQNPNHRYLSLSGVIVSLDYVASYLHPQIEELKRRYFGVHPDEHVILHRSELVKQRRPFEALQDPQVRDAFNGELMGLIAGLDYGSSPLSSTGSSTSIGTNVGATTLITTASQFCWNVSLCGWGSGSLGETSWLSHGEGRKTADRRLRQEMAPIKRAPHGAPKAEPSTSA